MYVCIQISRVMHRNIAVMLIICSFLFRFLSRYLSLLHSLLSIPSCSFLTGLGCALCWINLLRYFESFVSYYTLIIALRKGLPDVTRLVVSAFPIVLAYAFFGMTMFAELSTNVCHYNNHNSINNNKAK